MNQTRYCRVACLLMAALMCLCMWCGCETPEPETPKLTLMSEGGTQYMIVRSDMASATSAVTKLAVKMAGAFREVSGQSIDVTTDYEKEDGPYEILVGKSDRPEYKEALASLTDDNGYVIRAVGDKIVIAAKRDAALTEAVERFLAECVGWRGEGDFDKKGEIRVDAALNIEGVWIDPEAVPDDGNPKVLFGLSQQQADTYFADILDGLFTGDTQETIKVRDMGAEFRMHFPDIIYKDGEYWGYYITYDTQSGKGGVGLAVSKDGFNWKNRGCVLQPSEDYDCEGAYFAGVWLDDDGTFYLAYECKGGEETAYGTLENVALATSKDGVNWTKEGVILYKNTEVAWQSANVGTPDLYKKDGIWYLYFHGFDYSDCQIGVAYGEDLHNLTVVPDPIIPTKDNTPYSGTTGRRDVIFVGGYYYMVYEVSTDQAEEGGYNNAYWTHMFARSKDLIHWETIKAPILTQTNADGTPKPGFGYDGPCWMIVGKHIYVYVRVANKTTAVELTLIP